MRQIETRTLRSDRIEWLEVREAGRGDPAVVVVPPAVGHVEVIWPCARILAERRRVVSFSLRGEAGHDVPADFTWDDLLGDLDEVHRLAGIERSVLFGSSFGGALALRYALERPERIEALILNVTSARMAHLDVLRPLARWLDREAPRAAGELVRWYSVVACAPEVLALGPRKCLEMLAWMREHVQRHGTPRPTLGHRIRMMLDQDLEPRLGEISRPTLVLSGEDWLDLMVPRAVQRSLIENIPGARHSVVEGTGHLDFVTAPERVAMEVMRFLDSPAESQSEGHSG